MTINEWMNLRLKELNLSATQLITLSKVSKATVYKLLSEKTSRMPNRQTLSRLESVLGTFGNNSEIKKKYIDHGFGFPCDNCGNEEAREFFTSNQIDKKFVDVLLNSNNYDKYKKLRYVIINTCSTCQNEILPILDLSYPDLIDKLLFEFKISQKTLSDIVEISDSMITRLKNREVTFLNGSVARRLHMLLLRRKKTFKFTYFTEHAASRETSFFFRILAKYGYTGVESSITKLSLINLNSYLEIEDKVQSNFDTLQPDFNLTVNLPRHFGGGSIACFVLTYYDENVQNLFKTLMIELKLRYICFFFPTGFQSQIKIPNGYKCFELINHGQSSLNASLIECEIPFRRLPNTKAWKWSSNLNNI